MGKGGGFGGGGRRLLRWGKGGFEGGRKVESLLLLIQGGNDGFNQV